MKRLRAWLRRASGVFRQERRDAEFRSEHDERNCSGADPAGTNRDAAARAFAALALVLAGIGIYSVISYAVTRRTHEMGIRAALGAGEQSITRMVVREGLVLAAIGVMSGLAGVLVIRRMLSRLPVEVRVPLLFDVRPLDPATLASVSGILVLVALGPATCWREERRGLIRW